MTIREAIRSKQEEMRRKSPRERRAYFWEYHKTAVIALAALLAVGIFLAADVFGKKEIAFHGMFINAEERQGQQLAAGFAQAAGIDSEKGEIRLDSALKISHDSNSPEVIYGIEAMLAHISAGAIDTIACDGELLISFGYLDYLMDLRQVLTDRELESLGGSLLYIDRAVLEGLYDAAMDPENVPEDFPDPGNPAAMEDPVPVGILLNGTLDEAFSFSGTSPAIGIASTTNRKALSAAFIRYILAPS